jgi:hypothetical protein
MSSGRVTWELNQQWNICTNGTSLLTTISTIRANYDTGEKFMVTPDGTSIKLLPHGLSNAAHFNGSKVDDNWLSVCLLSVPTLARLTQISYDVDTLLPTQITD